MNAARRLASMILVSLCALAGALLLSAAPALAAAPETPERLEAKPIAATTATLNGVLNPHNAGEAGTYEFFYKQSATECQGEHQKTTGATLALGGKEEAATAPVGELLPHTAYTFCLLARNEAGEESALSSLPVTFTTLAAAPNVEEVSVADVASTSATFDAQVNPGGAETTYTFEYAPAGGSFEPVSEAGGSGSLPASAAAVTLSVHVQGLLPSTSYEFRLVASNSVEKVTGEPVSFTTQLGGGEFVLPDGRQYEMVTPPEKEGALFLGLGPFGFPETLGAIQASAEGNAIADLASQPTEAEPQGYSSDVAVFSARGPEGWSSRVIAPSRDVVASYNLRTSEYYLFSEDLSRGLVQQDTLFDPLSPEASEATPYLSTVYSNGNVGELCDAPVSSSSSCFRPLVTRADDTASPFEPFGEAHCEQGESCGPVVADATPDLSHVIISSGVQLTSAPTDDTGETGTGENALYEWFDGKLQLVSVFPKGEEVTGVRYVKVAGTAKGDGSVTPVHEGPGVRQAISDDGERVIFSTSEGSEAGGIYLRDVATSETVKIGTGAPVYMTANSDASKVFFLNEAEGNLEVFEVTSGADEPLAGKVTDLTVAQHVGESAGVMQVLGSSEDGSYVYFAAAGALTANATPAPSSECAEKTHKGVGCNIYVSHDGVTSLVAAGWMTDFNGLWSRVSPDGRWLAFMSSKNLTGYDTREALGAHADDEVYLYDASTGGLACASCDPTGARPAGVEEKADGFAEDGSWVAANVPTGPRGTVSNQQGRALHQPRYLSDSGRLFFESMDGLVSQDVNGVEDVYEYEPEGVPAGARACGVGSSSGSEVYKPARVFAVGGREGEEGAGCVALVSSGTSSEPSSFLDASESGGDVFFLTAARLAPQDRDSALDVYDAHECTSVSPCVPSPVGQPPACDTEASCRAAPLSQPAVFGVPSSATFSGSGNVTAPPSPPVLVKSAKKAKCARGLVKKRGRCVRVRKPRKRARKASRASHNGRSR
jgi:Tol biopolymer transport system component